MCVVRAAVVPVRIRHTPRESCNRPPQGTCGRLRREASLLRPKLSPQTLEGGWGLVLHAVRRGAANPPAPHRTRTAGTTGAASRPTASSGPQMNAGTARTAIATRTTSKHRRPASPVRARIASRLKEAAGSARAANHVWTASVRRGAQQSERRHGGGIQVAAKSLVTATRGEDAEGPPAPGVLLVSAIDADGPLRPPWRNVDGNIQGAPEEVQLVSTVGQKPAAQERGGVGQLPAA